MNSIANNPLDKIVFVRLSNVKFYLLYVPSLIITLCLVLLLIKWFPYLEVLLCYVIEDSKEKSTHLLCYSKCFLNN